MKLRAKIASAVGRIFKRPRVSRDFKRLARRTVEDSAPILRALEPERKPVYERSRVKLSPRAYCKRKAKLRADRESRRRNRGK